MSRIRSPELFFLSGSLHFFSIFLQQAEGVSLTFLSEAEEVRTIAPQATINASAARMNLFLIFMVVVLRFDENIVENVTVNLNFF